MKEKKSATFIYLHLLIYYKILIRDDRVVLRTLIIQS